MPDFRNSSNATSTISSKVLTNTSKECRRFALIRPRTEQNITKGDLPKEKSHAILGFKELDD